MTGRQRDRPSAGEADGQPDAGLDVLVASAGGHLTQLLALQEALGVSGRRVWITYDSAQGRELAASERVIFGHGPSTRNARAAVQNALLARRILAAEPVNRVISTGAGIAVPFLVQAAGRGIAASYVESATRPAGPSFSGRILERVPGVTCAAQWPWKRRGWREVPSVFKGFEPQPASDARHGESGHRILVTLGTHRYRFDRLVAQVARVVRAEDTVVWQVGATPPPRDAATVVADLTPAQFEDLLEGCDVVIGHAGLGTALAALRKGKCPILVPRRRAHDEHVDDHQGALARALHGRGLALAREADEVTRQDVALGAGRTVTVAETAGSHSAAPHL